MSSGTFFYPFACLKICKADLQVFNRLPSYVLRSQVPLSVGHGLPGSTEPVGFRKDCSQSWGPAEVRMEYPEEPIEISVVPSSSSSRLLSHQHPYPFATMPCVDSIQGNTSCSYQRTRLAQSGSPQFSHSLCVALRIRRALSSG